MDRGLQQTEANSASMGGSAMSAAFGAARRSGFTLLEVMVALLLLTGAFLAVAQLLVVAARAADQSRTTAIAATLAAQKLEDLRSLSWAYDIDGTPLDGLGTSPPGSLAADAAGFVDYLDDSGAPVGAGPPPPAQALFARRWSVELDAGVAPPSVLMLRVAVLHRGPPVAAAGEGARVWTEVTRVMSAKGRRSS
jgi:prepilin-type N-terminal cleavage/methylation domain-containing protein